MGLLTAGTREKAGGKPLRNDRLSAVVNGRDVATGKPRSLSLSAKDIHEPVKLFYDKIAEYAFSVIAKLPAEVAAEIRHAGIYLAGGGAEMTGLEDYFGRVFNMKINIPSEPAMSAMLGAGRRARQRKPSESDSLKAGVTAAQERGGVAFFSFFQNRIPRDARGYFW